MLFPTSVGTLVGIIEEMAERACVEEKECLPAVSSPARHC